MKNNIIDKIMQIYFKYLGISNIVLYTIYLTNSKEAALGVREIIFIIISSISMILIPVLYLVIMTKQEKLKNIHMYLNIIIVTICFDILLVSLGREFSFMYLIKSIIVSLVLFTPIRIIISLVFGVIINMSRKVILKNISN